MFRYILTSLSIILGMRAYSNCPRQIQAPPYLAIILNVFIVDRSSHFFLFD